MYSIYRSQAAAAPLAEAWELADATLREAILEASRLLERQLHQDPHEQGESRGAGVRILFQVPLGILYEVDDDKKLVRILRSWVYRTGADVREQGEW